MLLWYMYMYINQIACYVLLFSESGRETKQLIYLGHRLDMFTHHELFNSQGEGCGIQEDLAVRGEVGNDVIQHPLEVLRQQFISL